MKNSKWFRFPNSLKLVLASLVLLISYQNCSDVQFEVAGDKVLASLSQSVLEDEQETFQLSSNAIEPRYTIPGFSEGAGLKTENGRVIAFNSENNTFTYKPDPNYFGPDKVIYTVTDRNGRFFQDEFNIIVEPVNDLPEANDVTFEIQQGQSIRVSLPDLEQLWNNRPNFVLDIEDEWPQMNLQSIHEGQVNQNVNANGRRLTFIDNSDSPDEFIFHLNDDALGAYTHLFKVLDKDGGEKEFTITFKAENPLLGLEPALVVADTSCMFCHANVKGNVFSNFTNNRSDSQSSSTTVDLTKANRHFVGWSHNNAMVLGGSYIDGTFFLPDRDLSQATASHARNLFNTGKNNNLHDIWSSLPADQKANIPYFENQNYPIFKANQNSNVITLADYVDGALNGRTNQYFNLIANSQAHGQYPGVNGASTGIEVKNNIHIGAPSVGQIKQAFGLATSATNQRKYIPQGDLALPLSGLSSQPGYFKNGNVLTCDGDLYLNGILYLNKLRLRTNYGCRIYVTKTVVMYADPNGSGQGFELIDANPNDDNVPNLQITSARGILLGLGLNRLRARMVLEYDSTGKRISGAVSHDTGIEGDDLLRDLEHLEARGEDVRDVNARGGLKREIEFQNVLLNAPQVQSRYRGNFIGVIISGFLMPAVGRFKYEFDPIFNDLPILPKLEHTIFFDYN